MFMHPRKLTFVSLAIAFALGGIFGNYRLASAAPVMDEAAGVYTDDFASAAGVAASSAAGVDVADGMVKLKNVLGEFAPDYLASGTVTMVAIQPLRIAKWNTLSIVAATPPGTSIKVQIMDDYNHLFKDYYLSGNAVGISAFPVDLSNIPILQCGNPYFPGDPGSSFQSCDHPGKIIARFTLTSSDNTATPSIDSMQVTWTLSQGDLSPSTFADGWANVRHDQQGTFTSDSVNPQVYPAFRWSSSRYVGSAEGLYMLAADGKVFFPTSLAASQFVGLDSAAGTELWQTPTGYNATHGTLANNGTFYGAEYSTDKFYAIDMNTGQYKWTYSFYGGHGSTGTVMGNDGTIYYLHGENPATIYAFNPGGTIKWTKDFYPPDFTGAPQYIIYTTFSIGPDGTLYFSYPFTTNVDGGIGIDYLGLGKLVAVDPADGATKWTYASGDTTMWEGPLIDRSGTIYVFNHFYTKNHEVKVLAINPNGTLKWERNFGSGEFGIFNLALKNDGNIYALWNADGLVSSDSTILELSSTDGSTISSTPAGKSFDGTNLPYFTINYLTADNTGGVYYVDHITSEPTANITRLNYRDADHNMRWQIPYAYDSLDGNIKYSLASQIQDERGWVYSALGKYYNDGHEVPANEYAQAFALAPWTLTPATSPGAIYRGNTVTFAVTTSMQQTNPLTDEANKLQIVLDDNTKIPLVYSSTNGDGDTVWTADYTIPADVSFGTHNYTVEANAALVKTDIVVAFASPATGSENTGLTAVGTYTITRNGTTPSAGDAETVSVPSIAIRTPATNATYNSGATVGLEWSAANGVFTKHKVSFSDNNGASWTMIGESTNSAFSWIIPNTGTTQGLIKVEGYDGSGTLLATGISGSFAVVSTTTKPITNNQPPTIDSTISGTYDAAMAKTNTPDINTDKQLPAAPPFTALCVSGTLIKTESSPAVYYCGNDGKRYVFVNDKAYFSWYPDFSTVQTISEQTMAEIPIGGNITYRPGSRMVKIQSDPKVYAVARGGILRWIMTEAAAARLYGAAWNTMIDDVPDSFFVNYTLGEPITE